MTDYDPGRDLVQFARELKTLSPSKLAEAVLVRRNVKTTVFAVGMWLKRHPEIRAELESEMIADAPTAKDVIDEALFENGTFQEVASVKEWRLFMQSRRHSGKTLHPDYVNTQIRVLKFLCRKYTKHPDRMTYRDAIEIFAALENEGKDSYESRRVLKDFLKSKNALEWGKIQVGRPRGFGNYKDLVVDEPVLDSMLASIDKIDHTVYIADVLMYHYGLRVNEALLAEIVAFKRSPAWDFLKVIQKFRRPETYKIKKSDGDLIACLIADRKTGFIFDGVNEQLCARLNLNAIKAFCPEVLENYEHIHPNHFWRHMCAQRLKRLTHGNTPAVAALMKCTERSLTESYGAPTDREVEAWENEIIPQL